MTTCLEETELQQLRHRLVNKKQQVIDSIQQIRAKGNLSPDDYFLLRHKTHVELPEVTAALKRITESPESFGTCARCRASIPYNRLIQRPETRFCTKCLSRLEQQRSA